MSIEHRYRARHPVELEVHILYRRRRFYCAKGRKLSDQGMYLEVRNLTLPAGTMIELEFRALGRDWLIPAIVAHHSARGIGVMFREVQEQLVLSCAQPSMPLAQNRIEQPTTARLGA